MKAAVDDDIAGRGSGMNQLVKQFKRRMRKGGEILFDCRQRRVEKTAELLYFVTDERQIIRNLFAAEADCRQRLGGFGFSAADDRSHIPADQRQDGIVKIVFIGILTVLQHQCVWFQRKELPAFFEGGDSFLGIAYVQSSAEKHADFPVPVGDQQPDRLPDSLRIVGRDRVDVVQMDGDVIQADQRDHRIEMVDDFRIEVERDDPGEIAFLQKFRLIGKDEFQRNIPSK